MRARRLGCGAGNRACAVQHQTPLHARAGVAVGFIGEGGTQQIGAGHRGGEEIGGGIKARLIIAFSRVDTKLGPCANADVIVVIRVRLEAGQAGLIGDARGGINAQRVVER